MRALLRLLLALLAALWMAPLHAQDVQPVPPLSGRVVDTAQALNAAQRNALEAKLAAFEAEAGPQIVLLLVPATAPEDIASYSQRVADSWKIGRRQVGDGVLLVVAKNDRAVRIEVAKALEGAIPDLAARQIIDRALVPAFRAGDYAGGLNLALDQLMARIQGEGLPAPAARAPSQGRGLPSEQMLIFFFVGVMAVGGVLSAIFGRKLGSIVTAGAAGGLAWWLSASVFLAIGAGIATLVVVGLFGVGTVLQILAMTSGRGGGGGGGGGGGFSSGGGGDFGGGGASGRW